MIKGVNHQIIEVRQMGHPYFERALFFVNTAYAQQPCDDMEKEATDYLRRCDGFRGLREAKAMRWFKRCALVMLGVCVGAAVVLILSATP